MSERWRVERNTSNPPDNAKSLQDQHPQPVRSPKQRKIIQDYF